MDIISFNLVSRRRHPDSDDYNRELRPHRLGDETVVGVMPDEPLTLKVTNSNHRGLIEVQVAVNHIDLATGAMANFTADGSTRTAIRPADTRGFDLEPMATEGGLITIGVFTENIARQMGLMATGNNLHDGGIVHRHDFSPKGELKNPLLRQPRTAIHCLPWPDVQARLRDSELQASAAESTNGPDEESNMRALPSTVATVREYSRFMR